MRPVKTLGKGDAVRAQMHASRAFNQRMAGMTKKQQARRERLLQGQLHNGRVNILAAKMVAWFENEDAQPVNAEKRDILTADISKLLATMTWQQAAAIRDAAEHAYEVKVLQEQRERTAAEQPKLRKATPEELAEMRAKGIIR